MNIILSIETVLFPAIGVFFLGFGFVIGLLCIICMDIKEIKKTLKSKNKSWKPEFTPQPNL